MLFRYSNIFVFIRQVAPVPACWLFKTSATSWLNFDLLTLKVVSESRVTWATSVPILVFLGLSVLELGPMYTTDKRQTKSLIASALWGRRHNKKLVPWGTDGRLGFSILDRCIDSIPLHSVEHHSPTFAYVAISCRIKLSFYRRHFLPSSKSRDTKTRRNIKNPARSNLDIVLYFKN